MKTITPTLTPTTFFLPADDLRAAFQCISTEQTRYYLNGVLIEAEKLVALIHWNAARRSSAGRKNVVGVSVGVTVFMLVAPVGGGRGC